ncbi:triosephosphate isomerase [Caulobacter sp. AP07]|uniref:triose-phosphate isomerase n=1 Tax=Caulobacter sp. AP07 TaxID=1144304 RepID=UPI000272252B|nr:triose-phosphate isomerase [Caulobacter sp. AP07]EJL33297.1 triosephosphate isomerase [Caulobacter sp. AP07]
MAQSTPALSRLVVGNWKMNGGPDQLYAAAAIARATAEDTPEPRIAICPPATLLHRLSHVLMGSAIMTGGQDCHVEAAGAFTGAVSAGLLAEAGARVVILGHSDRRQGSGEDDALVARKIAVAIDAGLEPIVCVGETWAQRNTGQALEIVRRQVRGSLPPALAGQAFAVAYEPVWAIGTGERASEDDIAEMHRAIRRELSEMFLGSRSAPILYGGSVTPEGAAAILAAPEVGGVLVGGASLRAESFVAIIEAAREADRPARETRRADRD